MKILDSKEIKPVSPKGNQYSLEGLMLKLKLQYFGHLIWRTDSLEKNPDAGKDWRQEEKGTTEDEMVRWHHQLNGHESEQAPQVVDGQGSLVCCKELDMTEQLNQLNWTDWSKYFHFNTVLAKQRISLTIHFYRITFRIAAKG